MSKRILSLVLCCAMLLTCISGLTLISSAAENKVAAFDATTAYRGPGLDMQTKDGFTVFTWTPQNRDTVWYNNNMVPNALGITEETKADELAITLDCYWQRGENAGNDWWQFNTNGWTESDNVDNYFNLSQATENAIESNCWTEYTVTRQNQVLRRDGADSLFGLGFGDLSAESAFYVRGIKVVAKVGEDTYTALWGSYQVAKLDFTSGAIVGTNANITHNHMAENVKDEKKPAFSKAELNELGLAKVDGANYGMAMYQQNSGFGVHVADIGLTGQDVAVTVEYYIPADANVQGSTRYNMFINDKKYTLNYGGNGDNTKNAALSQGKWDIATFIVSGEDAAAFADGININAVCWNHNNNGYYADDGTVRKDWGGDYYFIRSISFMAADQLNTPADPGYDYYDFTNAYATNPYYPDYTQPDQVGMVWSLNGGEGKGALTENGIAMESGTLYMNSTRALGKSDVALKFFFAEDTTGNFTFQYNADAEKNPDYTGNINFKEIKPTIDENGVGIVILNDAAFAGKQAAGCSFRIYADGKTLERVEVYTLADKTALKAAIDGQITDFTGKTEASTNAYKALISKAQEVYDDVFALQADVDAATNALTGATLSDIIAIEAGENTLTAAQAATLNNCQLENSDSNIGMANSGSYIEYEVDVKTAGWYKVTFNSANGHGEGGDADQQLTDGEGNVYAKATIKADGNWGNYVDYDLGSIQLKAGVQRLRVFFTGGCNFKQMTLNYFVNVDALKEAVAAEITDLTDYTAASAATYTEAMSAAKAVLAKEDATQEEIDNALTALNAAAAALVKTHVDLPDPNLNQDANKTAIVEFEGKTALDLTTSANVTASIRWEMGTLKNAFNVANTDELDLEISADYYYVKAAEDGDYELWLNTYDKDGNADPNFGQTKLEGEGGLGLKTGEWATFTATRKARTFGNGSQFGDLLIQAFHPTWAEGTHLYIATVCVKVTLADGTVLTGTYNAKQPDKAALQAAVDGALTDLSGYTADSAKAYTDALAAAKAALEGKSFTQTDVDNAVAALNTAKDNLKDYVDPFAQINFEGDKINTVNGNILHNHPDEDDGDADNGIYKVAEDVDAYGIKLSRQNRGFGFKVDNSKQWLADGAKVRLVVEYYAPADAVRENTRVGISLLKDTWRVVRVGAYDGAAVSGLKTNELASFVYTLTAEEAANIAASGNMSVVFWNHNDDAETGGDYLYITSMRLEMAPDTLALEALVNENLNLDNYKADTTAAYKEALEAAKAVLANAMATQEEIDNAVAALNAAKAQMVALPSVLVSSSDGALTTHNGVEVLESADLWAHFGFSERMGLDTDKTYDLDMTVYYASTGTPWWQIQLSDAEGNRYSEGGKYSENDGFQQKADWLVNSNDEWTAGKASFKGVKFPIDDSEWEESCGTGVECDFGFHMFGRNPAPATDETEEVLAEVFIRGILFTVKDAEGNVVGTAMWGTKVEIPVVTTNLEAAIADAEKLNSEMYTEASAKALADALAAAKAVLADETADQDAIDAATAALNAAVAAMEMDSWDLIVESVTTTAGLNVKKGTPVQIIAVIKNVGTKTIPAGAKYGVAFAIGTKDEGDDEEEPTISYETICWSDNYKTTDTAPELKPGDTLTLISCGGGETIGEDENAKGGYWIPDEIGDFMLRAFVNDNEADGIKNEMSRDNNTLEVALKVTEDGLNVEALTAEIAKAEELDLTQYTEASAKAVTDALAAAKAVLANADATQADVDKAAADLTAAIEALVKTGVALGDVNGDNKIDTADAVLVLQYAAKLIDGTVISTAAADVNGDNKIDTTDAVLILQYVAKLIQQFPAAK